MLHTGKTFICPFCGEIFVMSLAFPLVGASISTRITIECPCGATRYPGDFVGEVTERDEE